ncbi:VOC family protein [Ferruginibacter paludis]|uniref:VOC family protein n=1 Tax=Ferruginibacter paludis TaxID=1310417 RepID=UPI0025B5B185|nr:VOC family protein [Ferruginibacter paludis]MDN3656884.1 VOC family protein [Ferruginibacter paludis]
MNSTFFAPHLTIRNGVTNIDFYLQAFDAVELRRFSNDDGSIHVSELSIGGNIFHLHEAMGRPNSTSPDQHNFSTVTIGLFVPDVDVVMQKAVAAGAIEISPAQDYDYGYRQGEFQDPFGHYWLIEQKI